MLNKKLGLLLSSCILVLTNCSGNEVSSSLEDESNIENSISSTEDVSTSSNVNDDIDIKNDELLDENYENCQSLNSIQKGTVLNWKEDYADKAQFVSSNSILYEEVYKNNTLENKKIDIGEDDDVKLVFYNQNYARFVSKPDGYAFTIPTNTTLNTDFSLGLYRSKLYNKDFTLTLSYEHSNPYHDWDTYRREWLYRYLDNENYYTQNNLSPLSTPRISDSRYLDGYIIDEYNLVINQPYQIRKNYYHIASIRKEGDIKNFILLVLKSTYDMTDSFEDIILSYKPVSQEGKANNNSMNDLPIVEDPNWNDETKAYYALLKEDQRTGWGAFTATLPDGTMTQSVLKTTRVYKKWTALSEALDYSFDILPTYQHIAWYKETSNYWPTTAATSMAGGNGFNNKPVIQMSYQFTDNNNNVSVSNTTDCYTPMFDIYRGSNEDSGIEDYYLTTQYKYAAKLRGIAHSIKSYGKPVLFRLNNEMNSDWVSYCGMMTLLDPDIFQATWRIIYNAFIEEGVDNCIWIFNPNGESCPFSSWGEDLCYYPGVNYVQALGLTAYQANNNNDVNYYTFRNDYTKLYEKNNPVWNQYPWIISEFGCGAGGETTGTQFRNQASQVEYVRGMFDDFNDRENHPYLQNIKGAVWFSVNDYSGDQVVNQYELVIDELQDTIAALKAGLAPNKI